MLGNEGGEALLVVESLLQPASPARDGRHVGAHHEPLRGTKTQTLLRAIHTSCGAAVVLLKTTIRRGATL